MFHAGPVVRKTDTGWKLGVIGPTSSIRMEPYAEMVGELGVKAIIGKGGMHDKSRDAFQGTGKCIFRPRRVVQPCSLMGLRRLRKFTG